MLTLPHACGRWFIVLCLCEGEREESEEPIELLGGC